MTGTNGSTRSPVTGAILVHVIGGRAQEDREEEDTE